MRVLILIAVLALAGCGARKPVTRPIPGDFLGYKLAQLPRGYGIRCPPAMRSRHGGTGDGASARFDAGGRQLVTAALRFPDAGAARRAYAAAVSPATQRCYAAGFAAEVARRYGGHVRQVRTRPAPVAGRLGDERAGSRVSVVIALGRRAVTVSADSSAVRTGSALSLDQVIDLSALGRRAAQPDLRLAQAV